MMGPPRGMFQFSGASPVTTDPLFSFVSLLLHFDGTNGSSTFTDNSSYARSASLVGTPTLDTSTQMFGTASGKFVAASTCGLDYGVSTNQMRPFYQPVSNVVYSCVECWFKTTSSTVGQRIMSHMEGAFTNGSWALTMSNNYTGGISFYYRPYNAALPMLVTTVTAYNDGAWHHVAVTLENNVFKLWLDGTLKASQAFTASNSISSTNFSVGRDNNYGLYFDGWIDELRITTSNASAGGNTGTCRYTTNFTPSGPFPNS